MPHVIQNGEPLPDDVGAVSNATRPFADDILKIGRVPSLRNSRAVFKGETINTKTGDDGRPFTEITRTYVLSSGGDMSERLQVQGDTRYKRRDITADAPTELSANIGESWKLQKHDDQQINSTGKATPIDPVSEPILSPLERTDMPGRLEQHYEIGSSRMDPLGDGSEVAGTGYMNGSRSPIWYDRSQVQSGIVYESIANTGNTKSKFERMSSMERGDYSLKIYRDSLKDQPEPPSKPPTGSDDGLGLHQSRRDGFERNSKEIRQELAMMAREIDQSQRQFYSLPRSKIHGSYQKKDDSARGSYRNSVDYSLAIETETNPDRERELLLIYLRRKRELLDQMGLKLPPHVCNQMDQLAARSPTTVALVEISGDQTIEQPAQPMAALAIDQDGSYNTTWSNGFKEDSVKAKGPGPGRYVKNIKTTTSAPPAVSRKMPMQKSGRDSPRGGRSPIFGEPPTDFPADLERRLSGSSREEVSDGEAPVYRSAGESLVAREIREAKEREAELSQSRSELGLPSLNEILVNWRDSTDGDYPVRSAQSLETLQHLADDNKSTYVTISSVPTQQKQRSNSLSYLTQMAQNDTQPDTMEQMDNTVRPSTMPGKLRLWEDLNPPSSPGVRSGERTPTGISAEIQLSGMATPKTPSGRKLSKGQYQQFISSYNERALTFTDPQPPPLSPYRPVVEIPPTYRKRQNFVPMEARIEQEVEELRRREEELRMQRQELGYVQAGRQTPVEPTDAHIETKMLKESDEAPDSEFPFPAAGSFNKTVLYYEGRSDGTRSPLTKSMVSQETVIGPDVRTEITEHMTADDISTGVYPLQTSSNVKKSTSYYITGSYKAKSSDPAPKAFKPASHYKGTKLADGMIL